MLMCEAPEYTHTARRVGQRSCDIQTSLGEERMMVRLQLGRGAESPLSSLQQPKLELSGKGHYISAAREEHEGDPGWGRGTGENRFSYIWKLQHKRIP